MPPRKIEHDPVEVNKIEDCILCATNEVENLRIAGVENDPYWPANYSIADLWLYFVAEKLGRAAGLIELLDMADISIVDDGIRNLNPYLRTRDATKED